ncbi:MAG: tetratricopeptide repeat protein, partial [Planctomycetota bacterium]
MARLSTHRPTIRLVLACCVGALLLDACGDSSSPDKPSGPATSGGPHASAADVDALIVHALELSKRGRHVDGVRHLRAALPRITKGDLGRTREVMARLQHRVRSWDAALSEAEAAIAAGNSSADVRWIRADAKRELSKADEALKELDALLASHPDHAQAHLSRGSIRFRNGEAKESLADFEAYFDHFESPSIAAQIEYGRALRSARRFQDAANQFGHALERDPFLAEPYSELATTLFRLKQQKAGKLVQTIYTEISQRAMEEHVAEGLQRTGSTATGLTQQAINEMRYKRFVASWNSYREAVDAGPDDPRIRIYYSELCLRFHLLTQAREIVAEGRKRELKPASGLLWVDARIAAASKDWPRTLDLALQSLETLKTEGDLGGYTRGQANASHLVLLAIESAVESVELERAKQLLAVARTGTQDAWRLDYWRGRVALAEKSEDAAAFFAKASARGGQAFPEVSYHNARAIFASGQTDVALKQLELLLESSPFHLEAHRTFQRWTGSVKDPARFNGAEAHEDALRRLKGEIDRLGFEKAGAQYLDLGLELQKEKNPVAFDFFAIAVDLLPDSRRALLRYVAGILRPQDIFLRLHFVRRLHELEPNEPQ